MDVVGKVSQVALRYLLPRAYFDHLIIGAGIGAG